MEGPETIKIFSYPKAGRTWTTYLWYFYALAVTDSRRLFDERPARWRAYQHPDTDERFKEIVWPVLAKRGLPLLRFTHGFRPEDGKPTNSLLAKGIRKKRLVVLVRHPADTLVSFYHYVMARRSRYVGADKINTFPDLLASPLHGYRPLADYYHLFDSLVPGRQIGVRYEDMIADTAGTFRGILLHCGHEVDEAALAYAVENSTFERLKAIEQAQPEVRDRFRRGLVGGYNSEVEAGVAAALQDRVNAENCSLWSSYVK